MTTPPAGAAGAALLLPEGFVLPAAGRPRAVVLVEGMSDKAALEALAERRGMALGDDGIVIAPMGGATNIGHFLAALGQRGPQLAGLCDSGEEGHFRQALARAGFGAGLTRAQMEDLGFYVCVTDLEDELIRALGTIAVEQIIEAQGEIGSFRTFCKQPAQRGRSRPRQLHRFMGTRSGRKSLYARLLVNALDLGAVPRPLDRLMAHLG
jgi:hypothetical protein